MGALLGLLGITESDLNFMSRLGQSVVYDGIKQYLDMHNQDIARMEAVLVQGSTEEYKFRYKLPGGGYLQRRGSQASSAAVKTTGSWDVALGLEDYGADLLTDDVTMAYMTPAELEAHVDTVRAQDLNTRRLEILRSLYNNTTRSFDDERGGTLTIQPLANGDSVVYPPVIGSSTEATQNNYLVSGYVVGDISATNNPLITVRRRLEGFFGRPQGFGNVAHMVNPDDLPEYEGLADYRPVEDINLQYGDDTDRPINMPNVPGRVAGRANGVWVVEWDYVPANYSLTIDPDAPKPLMKRIDPARVRAALGIGEGLSLVASNQVTPLINSSYRNRFGYGVVNRLNGVVTQYKASGSYEVPSGYAY